eukprot:3885886-Ditylum_brightwellii.AAC.1
MADKVGCHGLVLGSTQGCLCFPSEARLAQPHISKEGVVVGIIYCLWVSVFGAKILNPSLNLSHQHLIG